LSDLHAYYAARAREYDAIYAKPERQSDLRQLEAWLPAVFAGRTVLEIACGTGYWTQFIAPAAAHVVAIDASTEVLAIARTRVPPARVDLRVGDAYLPPRGAFSGSFAGFWLSHVPRKRLREFLRGLHAVLAPGARVVWLDNRYVEGSSTPLSRRDAQGNSYQQRRLDDGSVHEVLKNFPTRDEAIMLLGPRARDVEWIDHEHYWILSYLLS
jgi:demethylmenaquinone methyltransferase/2-methoxy-6-polyprenyl-1,4-benzoquinol methylase